MSDPYRSPQSDLQPERRQPRRFSPRSIWLTGVAAAGLVYAGDALTWPYFNRREGYPGTEWAESFLYAVNDPYAIHLFAAMWFGYGVLLTSVVRLICHRLYSAR